MLITTLKSNKRSTLRRDTFAFLKQQGDTNSYSDTSYIIYFNLIKSPSDKIASYNIDNTLWLGADPVVPFEVPLLVCTRRHTPQVQHPNLELWPIT